MDLVETRLRDPTASTALGAEVARLLEKGAITTVFLPLLHGFQEVRGEETYSGSLRIQQICCHEEIQNAHYQSAALMCERGRLVHIPGSQGCLSLSIAYLLSLRALHIAGVQNFRADLTSRGGPRRDEWRLHPEPLPDQSDNVGM